MELLFIFSDKTSGEITEQLKYWEDELFKHVQFANSLMDIKKNLNDIFSNIEQDIGLNISLNDNRVETVYSFSNIMILFFLIMPILYKNRLP